jgi:hypothetical protein
MSEARQAILALIAARLTLLKADRVLKACASEEISIPTVSRILKGHDHKISTLIALADALECDVEITIQKR